MTRKRRNFMIKLKNIVIEENVVKCDIFPEDSKKAGKIEFDLTNKKIINFILPTGYEWCKKHIQHAIDYLIEARKAKEKMPNEKLIMWH